ncbi:MAG: hypothetical protein EOP22_12320 [Hyphomicrobiales bacterium]|nr:MAG: hypothetical protein EOP22_12320 [Hyphomicrobiales bacterium]
MLYFLTKAYHCHTIWGFIWGAGWRRVPYLQPMSYEELFSRRRAPRGHYVFTDFDRMSAYEIQCAATVAETLKAADPAIRIYNHPLEVLERTPLLSRLQQVGINDFGVWRLDQGHRPSSYPVFIRAEDDCMRPDTGLLHNEAELDLALQDMKKRGIPLKRRIAVQYHAQSSPDGYFRKYGGINIGGKLVLQHILRNTEWYVKRGQVERDANSEREFLELFDNYEEHAEVLAKVFATAGIDYGRADYGFVDGRLQVFEINTNPTIPKLRKRRDRYARLRPTMLEAFEAMNQPPHSGGKPVPFELPKPVFERFPPVNWRMRNYKAGYWLMAASTLLRDPSI